MPFIFNTSGTGSGGTIIIQTGFLTSSFLLSAAALTGGAVIATATGTLPQRISEVIETYITGTTQTRSGVVFDPDGNHFWTTDGTANQIKRYVLATGVINAFRTGSTTDPTRNTLGTPQSLIMGFSNRIWFASQTNHLVGYIDPTTLAIEMFSGTLSNPNHVVEHTPGKILVRGLLVGTSPSTYTEFSFSGTGSANTVAYTGKQIIEGTTFWDCIADLTSSVYTTNATTIIKRDATTLTASATFTPQVGNWLQIPGYGITYRQIAYHPSAAKLYARQANEDSWLALNVAGMTVAGRVFDDSEYENPPGGVSTNLQRSTMTFSPDGTKMVFFTYEREAAATVSQHFRTMMLQPQRARWSWAPGANVHVKSINFAGMFGNQVGSMQNMPAHTWLNSEYDTRRTKFYYSLNGGSSRTEFRPSEFIDLAVTSAQTLTVDVEMQKTPLNNNGPDPWIGDKTVDGLAGSVIYSQD